MAAATIPSGGISLHGAPNGQGSDSSTFARSAVLLHLNEQIIRDIKQCSQAGKTVQLLAGKSPRLRIGPKSLDIRVTPEAFRHELYASQDASGDYSFTALVTQQAELKTTEKAKGDTAGADAALAALKQNLAVYAQEKEAKQATISTSVLPGSRKGASRPNSLMRPNSLLHPNRFQFNSPSSNASTPRSGTAPTSAPMVHVGNLLLAEQKALIHLLAIKPLTLEEIVRKTRIQKDSCLTLLKRIGQQALPNSEWSLQNKTFKELDVWSFRYQNEEDRQKAVDNAVRAYDRLRVEKHNPVWQKLLPVDERGKGKSLSRLPTNSEASRVGTPGAGASPLPSGDDAAERTLTARGTPSLESKTTPRMGATAIGRGGIKIGKLLKDSKKKHAVEEAKEKKRKEKEAAASDIEGRSKPREVVKGQTKKMAVKKQVVKSAEVVHSSEEDEGEIVEHAEKPTKDATNSSQQPNREAVTAKPKASAMEPKKVNGSASQPSAKPRSGTVSDSSDASAKPKSLPPKDRFTPSVTKKSEQLSAASAVRAKDLPASKETPLQRPVKKSSATINQQTQLSPRKANTKPTVPSPLGATRPRNASDVSEKPASAPGTISKGTKPNPPPAAAKTVKPSNANNRPAEGSGPQKQPPVAKKRARDDDTSAAEPPRKVIKGTANGNMRSGETPHTNGPATNTDNHLKRKTNDLSCLPHSSAPVSKHRKTESHASSSLATTTARTSPSPSGWRSERSSSASSTVQLSWERALDESDKFRNEYYPAYVKLYDRLQAMDPSEVSREEAGKLWRMHHRLQQMKKEIRLAREDE